MSITVGCDLHHKQATEFPAWESMGKSTMANGRDWRGGRVRWLMRNNVNPIILYDGVCGLCDRFTQLVLKRDKQDLFRFASLQSEFASQILRGYGVDPQQLDTVYVVRNFQSPDQQLLSRSDAAIFVFQQIGGIWRAAALTVRILPRPLRDAAYNLVARNRYRWFGKYDTCLLPDPSLRHKFLG